MVDGKANIELTVENDSVGIHAPFAGGGSCMDIHLEKDVVLPAEFCGKAERYYRVGDCNLNVGEMSVKQVYGVGNDFYQSCETTNKPATIPLDQFQKLIHDDVKNLKESMVEKKGSKGRDVAKEAKDVAKGGSGKQAGRDSEVR